MTGAMIVAMADDFYKQYDQATVYCLNGQTACFVTWNQFVRLGQPQFQSLSAADGQSFRDACAIGATFCTDKQVGL